MIFIQQLNKSALVAAILLLHGVRHALSASGTTGCKRKNYVSMDLGGAVPAPVSEAKPTPTKYDDPTSTSVNPDTPENCIRVPPKECEKTLAELFKEQYISDGDPALGIDKLWQSGNPLYDAEGLGRSLFSTKNTYTPTTKLICDWTDLPPGCKLDKKKHYSPEETTEITGQWGVYQYISLRDVTYTVWHHQDCRIKKPPFNRSIYRRGSRWPRRRNKDFEQTISFSKGDIMYIGKAGGQAGVKGRTTGHTYGNRQLCDKIFQIAKKHKIETGEDLIAIQWMQMKDIRGKFHSTIVGTGDHNKEVLTEFSEKECHGRMEAVLLDAHQRAKGSLPKLNIQDETQLRQNGKQFGKKLKLRLKSLFRKIHAKQVAHERIRLRQTTLPEFWDLAAEIGAKNDEELETDDSAESALEDLPETDKAFLDVLSSVKVCDEEGNPLATDEILKVIQDAMNGTIMIGDYTVTEYSEIEVRGGVLEPLPVLENSGGSDAASKREIGEKCKNPFVLDTPRPEKKQQKAPATL